MVDDWWRINLIAWKWSVLTFFRISSVSCVVGIFNIMMLFSSSSHCAPPKKHQTYVSNQGNTTPHRWDGPSPNGVGHVLVAAWPPPPVHQDHAFRAWWELQKLFIPWEASLRTVPAEAPPEPKSKMKKTPQPCMVLSARSLSLRITWLIRTSIKNPTPRDWSPGMPPTVLHKRAVGT